MAGRRSPHAGRPQVTGPSPPCPACLLTGLRILTAEGAGRAVSAPGLESWATGSSVTGQSRGPGCLTLRQPVQQTGSNRTSLFQSCRLHGQQQVTNRHLCTPPPPPDKPAACCGCKDRITRGSRNCRHGEAARGSHHRAQGVRAGGGGGCHTWARRPGPIDYRHRGWGCEEQVPPGRGRFGHEVGRQFSCRRMGCVPTWPPCPRAFGSGQARRRFL